ncbi:DUF4175 domain-containing protein [Komagataeibacter sp. FNDCR2]|uniref:DUF4175 domain-containing protein n=1 Tax=Komagataeibacter sp. FNDCR2 TaxID=2878682 RepID=UPI001E559186|nr:DUF4175 family protein [Komagataeibacter sp. FNDCR2]MCE2573943.1 DUF4175 domain-containing protein [Komagataeibacter sp. FNDCR2]
MTTGQDSTQPGGDLPQRLAHARQQARRALWVERLWPLMLPGADAALGVGVLGLARLPQSLPDAVHTLLLAAIAAGAGYATWRAGERIRPPTAQETDRRVEQASGLSGQPLRTLYDRPANPRTPEIVFLWQRHLQRVTAELGHLRGGWPRPRLHAAGRWQVTAALGVLLAGGLLWSGGHAPSRIAAAFLPGMDDADTPAAQVNAWITMPDYAPGAPVFLDAAHTDATIPAGAQLTVTLNGLNGHPALRMRGAQDPALGPHDFRSLGNASWSAQATLLASGTLTLRGRGRVLTRWNLKVTPNPAPEIAWGKDPGSHDGEWRTRLPYHVSQPYGIASMHAELVMPDSPRDRLDVPIPLNGHPRMADDVATPDLSENPWAGEDVTARLVATSSSGVTATSAPVRLRIGARSFRNPLAKAILDIRKRIALRRENRTQGMRELLALGQADTMLTHQVGLLLALTSTAAMLDSEDVPDDYAITQATGRLWFLALDIEHNRHDINNEQADFGVQAAQEAVRQQLEHMRQMGPAGQGPDQQAELQHRMQALKDAISRKMQALAQQAMREHSAMPAIPEMTARGEQNLGRMMQQLQDDAAGGRNADAMQKLQQMEDMAESMRNATPQDMVQLAQQMQARQRARELRHALRDLTARQSQLLDHAQSRLDQARREQERDAAKHQTDMDEDGSDLSALSTADLLRQLGITPPGGAPAPASPPPSPESMTPEARTAQQHADRAVQHALARALHELRHEFKQFSGKDTPALDKAQTDMKAVRAALATGGDPDAANAEKKVLADLQQGDQQMRQSIRNQGAHGGMTVFLPMLSQGNGQGSHGSGGNRPGEEDDDDDADQQPTDSRNDRDPLGRKTGDTRQGMDNDTHVPDNASRERAREIEQELRRRDADRTRPPEELEYLDRLLRAF